MTSPLARLSQWYARHCDGDWEHHHGISIRSSDNPGWLVDIDLTGTDLAGRSFVMLTDCIGPTDHPDGPRWMQCELRDGHWTGAGDETRLDDVLTRFLDWAEA